MIVTHTNVKITQFPMVTLMLIVINVCVFIKSYSLEINANQEQWGQFTEMVDSVGQGKEYVPSHQHANAHQKFFYDYGFSIPDITERKDYLSLFTHMFVHDGLAHIIGNMIMLWGFGVAVEEAFGSSLFALFYLVCGFIAAFAQGFMGIAADIPCVGASGAIAGVMGAFFVLYGAGAVVYWMLFLGFRPFFVPIPAPIFGMMWIGSQLFYLQMETSLGGGEGGGVAWMAHIGGVLGGILLGMALRRELKGEIIEHDNGAISVKAEQGTKAKKLNEQEILEEVLALHPVRTVVDTLLGENARVLCPKCEAELNVDFTMANRMCKCMSCQEMTYIDANVLLRGQNLKELNF
jgi:membrane associated rhomboid family serine protease